MLVENIYIYISVFNFTFLLKNPQYLYIYIEEKKLNRKIRIFLAYVTHKLPMSVHKKSSAHSPARGNIYTNVLFFCIDNSNIAIKHNINKQISTCSILRIAIFTTIKRNHLQRRHQNHQLIPMLIFRLTSVPNFYPKFPLHICRCENVAQMYLSLLKF